ncbi:hypothetical protein O6H91_15G061400 [Diphasiastrum complanatum]|uniref:Uncharacterized protein n=1 Tax=Diphasiastrum complanatum TaxID=34168 RepID=A0ACC2BIR7_DIPCM|nr:hypothetical protein O6H91_15G061400 [Diphasiastrum complanatum]
MKEILERYERNSDPLQIDAVIPRDLEYWSREAAKAKEELDRCHQKNRHMLGEDLSALSLKELEELEQQLDSGLRRVRCRKDQVLRDQIDELTKQECFLREENRRLRSKIPVPKENTEPILDEMNMETREPPSAEIVEKELSLQLNNPTWPDVRFSLRPYQPPPSDTPTANHRPN